MKNARERLKQVIVVVAIAVAVVGYCIIVFAALYALSHLTPGGLVTPS